MLRREREARNISLEEIASRTKIVRRYLEALEADRFDIMPGGFFVKAIIRTYARTVGLDEEDVLSRYRAAGVLTEGPAKRPAPPPPPSRTVPPRPRILPAPKAPSDGPVTPAPSRLPTPAPPTSPAFPSPPAPPSAPAPPESAAPPAPAEPSEPPSAPLPPSPAIPSGPLFTAEAGPSSRKKLLRGLAAAAGIILIIALVFLLWTVLRPKPAPEPMAGAIPGFEPSTPAAEAVTDAPTPSASAENIPQESAPQPPPPDEMTGITMEIVYEAETWMQVYADGLLKVDGLFPPGAKATVRADTELLIHVGNAGGFRFLLNGRPGKPLGRTGAVIKDIRITADNYKEFLQAPSPEPPAG